MADLGRARYRKVQPGTVLKRPIMCYIRKAGASRISNMILADHLGTTNTPLEDHYKTTTSAIENICAATCFSDAVFSCLGSFISTLAMLMITIPRMMLILMLIPRMMLILTKSLGFLGLRVSGQYWWSQDLRLTVIQPQRRCTRPLYDWDRPDASNKYISKFYIA